MKHNQSAEDYLEAILLLSGERADVHQVEVARKTGVSQPAVQKALKALQEKGYISWDGLHIVLTASGKQYAEHVYVKHCTIRKFLQMHGVDYAAADADACEMEHVISRETWDMIRTFVEKEGR